MPGTTYQSYRAAGGKLSVGTLAGNPCREPGEAELGMPNGGQQAGEGELQWIQNPSFPGTWWEKPWKLCLSFQFVYLSLVIYLVFPKRSLGGDFNIVKFVEML